MLKFNIYIILLFSIICFSQNRTFGLDLVANSTLSESFNDNINTSSDNAQSDFVTDVNIGLGLKSESDRSILNIISNLSYSYYLSHSDLSSFSEDFLFNYDREISIKDKISIKNTFKHYPEPKTFEEQFNRASTQDAYFVNTASFSYWRNALKQLAFNLKYENTINKSEGDSTTDSLWHSGSFLLSYYFTSKNITHFGYDYTLTTYENDTSYVTHTGTMAYQHFFTKTFYLMTRGGFDYIQVNKTDEVITYSKPHYYVMLYDFIDDRTGLQVYYSKKYSSSIDSATLYDYQVFSANINRELSSRIGSSLAAFYGYGKYIESGETNSLLGVSFNFSYLLSRQIILGTKYSFTTKKASSENSSATNNIFSLYITGKL